MIRMRNEYGGRKRREKVCFLFSPFFMPANDKKCIKFPVLTIDFFGIML